MLRLALLFLLTFNCSLQGSELNPIRSCNCHSDPDYILDLRPAGALGKQLSKFWKRVKDRNLKNPAVLNYPPHCSLTGFFPGKTAAEEEYIEALKQAVNERKSITINIKTLQQKPKLDFIHLTSPDLFAITSKFVKLIGISPEFIKGKPKTFGYHISLRQKTDEKITPAIRKLENKTLNLKAKNLSENTTWALYLYRKSGSKLEELAKIPIETN